MGDLKISGNQGIFSKNWIFFQNVSADYSAHKPPTETYYPSLESLFCQLCGQYKYIFLTWKLVVKTADWKKAGDLKNLKNRKNYHDFQHNGLLGFFCQNFDEFLNRPFRPLTIVTAKCAIPLSTSKKCSFHMRYDTLLY